MIKSILLSMTVIHASAVVTIIWMMLFDLVHLDVGQNIALILIALIGFLFFLTYLGMKNEEVSE